jgi:hypothetical protein
MNLVGWAASAHRGSHTDTLLNAGFRALTQPTALTPLIVWAASAHRGSHTATLNSMLRPHELGDAGRSCYGFYAAHLTTLPLAKFNKTALYSVRAAQLVNGSIQPKNY